MSAFPLHRCPCASPSALLNPRVPLHHGTKTLALLLSPAKSSSARSTSKPSTSRIGAIRQLHQLHQQHHLQQQSSPRPFSSSFSSRTHPRAATLSHWLTSCPPTRLAVFVQRPTARAPAAWTAAAPPSFVQHRPLSDTTKPTPPRSSSSSPQPVSQDQPDQTGKSEKPIAKGIELAKEKTKAVGEKIRSKLTSPQAHENIYNVPNILTVSRLIAAPTCAYLLLHDHNQWALALFAYAGITDLVDGWIARKWNLQTVAGSVMDPMADKALMIVLTATLAIKGALPLYLATLILGRDASLAIAAIYYRYASLPAPKTFMRYWDFSLPSAEVHPTTVSKYNTFLQLVLIGSTLALPVLAVSTLTTTSDPSVATAATSSSIISMQTLDTGMLYFQYLVAATTAWSGLSYAYLKNAVTILGTNEELKKLQGKRGRAIIGVTFGSVVLLAGYLGVTVDEERSKEKEREKEARVV